MKFPVAHDALPRVGMIAAEKLIKPLPSRWIFAHLIGSARKLKATAMRTSPELHPMPATNRNSSALVTNCSTLANGLDVGLENVSERNRSECIASTSTAKGGGVSMRRD